WGELASFFGQVNPVDDLREGPRTWRWAADAQRRKVMRVSNTWLTEVARGRAVPESPPELKAGKPGPTHPVQFIPPEAALFMASQVGCRLPTSAEWLAAAGPLKSLDAGACNLRDQSWGAQQQYCAGLSRGGPVQWPDA